MSPNKKRYFALTEEVLRSGRGTQRQIETLDLSCTLANEAGWVRHSESWCRTVLYWYFDRFMFLDGQAYLDNVKAVA
ncbi:hypothetical protein [Saccharopolyspora sp. NPDC002376]